MIIHFTPIFLSDSEHRLFLSALHRQDKTDSWEYVKRKVKPTYNGLINAFSLSTQEYGLLLECLEKERKVCENLVREQHCGDIDKIWYNVCEKFMEAKR